MGGEIEFYTHPMSRGRVVRWMLEEAGVPYRTIVLEYGTTMKAPEFLAINPMGKVPAIRHAGVVVTGDSRHLRLPGGCLSRSWPGAPAGRPAPRRLLPVAVLLRRTAGSRLGPTPPWA